MQFLASLVFLVVPLTVVYLLTSDHVGHWATIPELLQSRVAFWILTVVFLATAVGGAFAYFTARLREI